MESIELNDESAIRALRWITDILHRRAVPYQITGGLAAKVYGSKRTLNDIDIEVPDARIVDIIEDIRQWIVLGPELYRDERWNVALVMLQYHGQEIDVCGSDGVTICDARTGHWISCASDLSLAEHHKIDDMIVPVMPPHFLATYKRMLVGSHQLIDIEAIEQLLCSRNVESARSFTS